MEVVFRNIFECFKKSKRNRYILLGVIVSVSIILLFTFLGPTIKYTVTPESILNEYIEDSLAASVKYDDEIIEITGVVRKVEGDNDRAGIYLSPRLGLYQIILVFTDEDEIDNIVFEDIQIGQEITVVGTVIELDVSTNEPTLVIMDCVLKD